MIINIICTILSSIGIYGYFVGNNMLLIIGTGAVIIELLIGIITGETKSLATTIIAAIIGIIITDKIWIGIGIGICFESVIMSVLGWLLIFLGLIFNKKNKQLEENDNSWEKYLENHFESSGTTTNLNDIRNKNK